MKRAKWIAVGVLLLTAPLSAQNPDRALIIGLSAGGADHLADHSLQQFVNNLTNRPVRFGYEAFGFEGKQVGIIRVEQGRIVLLDVDALNYPCLCKV